MGKLLIRLGKWLDSRFPQRFCVTEGIYDALTLRVRNFERSTAGLTMEIHALQERLSKLENEVKIAEEKKKAHHKSEAEKLRDTFILTGTLNAG